MAPSTRNGGGRARALAASDALSLAEAPVDTLASAEVSTGSADVVSAPVDAPLTGLSVGAELLCEPFETGAAAMGTVASIEGEEVELLLVDHGTTWPVTLACIDVAAGTWEHVAADYPVPGSEPVWDAGHRPWLASTPAAVAAVIEAPALPAEAIVEPAGDAAALATLASLVAPLVGVDGTAINVPLATTAPQLAEPESVAPAFPSPEELRASMLETAMTALLVNHPGPGWALCRVNGPGSISGTWIQQSTGKHLSVARPDDVGFFTEATLTKFDRIGHGDLLTRL